jgi:cell division protein FtsA
VRARRAALLAGGVLLAAGAATFRGWGPPLLREVPWFDASRIEVAGARLLAPHEVVSASGVRIGASIWTDPAAWEAALRRHPVVADATVERRLPSTLRIRVREKRPVALVAAGTLRPATAAGELLPVDPVRVPVDLPLAGAAPDTATRVADPAVLRLLAEAARLAGADPVLMARVSELAAGPEGLGPPGARPPPRRGAAGARRRRARAHAPPRRAGRRRPQAPPRGGRPAGRPLRRPGGGPPARSPFPHAGFVMRPTIAAGLDIGSSKTAVVVAEVSGEGPRARVKILGVGQARTGGIRREVVTDIEATTESVRKAVKEAELMAGVSVQKLYTGIAGEHIHAWPSTGVVAVQRDEITPGDVERVHEVARAVVVPADRELIHAIPQEYIVDAQDGIRDPVGMAGTRLEAEVFIVTGAATAGQNIRKAVSRAGYRWPSWCWSRWPRRWRPDQRGREGGGGGAGGAGRRHHRRLRLPRAEDPPPGLAPLGGRHGDQRHRQGALPPLRRGGARQGALGAARSDLVRPGRDLRDPAAAAGQTRHVARELLAHIIEQRLDEILGLVAAELERGGFAGLGGGIVLTGGGASLHGIVELAERSFAAPVRIGVPGEGLGGLADSVRRPKFATAAGLAIYGSRRLASDASDGGALAGGSVGGVVRWVRDWFSDFF